MSGLLLWSNPLLRENGPSWHRDVTWWGTGAGYFAQREVRGEGPEAYSEEIEQNPLERDSRKQRETYHGTEQREHVLGTGGRRMSRVDTG